LKEVLLLAKGKIKVCVEIKIYGIEQEVVDIIRETEMIARRRRIFFLLSRFGKNQIPSTGC
jgi:hypothetical protein